jgi:putative transposase
MCAPIAAPKSAIGRRNPLPGLLHRSDRGSQYAAERYHDSLTVESLLGAMGWRGNRFDNVQSGELLENREGRGDVPDGV